MQILLLFLFSASSWAIDRTQYIQEASLEMRFYFQHANSDGNFLKKLNSKETKQFLGILDVVNRYSKIPLQFSENQEDFVLHPGEPPRSAKTTPRFEDPIWINLKKLNDEREELNYLSVLQLLVHELGHKLGKDKDQIAVDSLATKFVDYLRPFYRNEKTFWRVSEGDRPMKERLEFLSLPKQATNANPNPSLFFINEKKAWKIHLHFEQSLKLDASKFVRVDRTIGEQINGGIYTSVYLSVYQQFTRKSGEKIYALNGSYTLAEQMPFGFELPGEPYDKNFRLARLKDRYPSATMDSFVEKIEEVSRSAKEVKWKVSFETNLPADKIALVAGTEDRYFLISCEKSIGNTLTAICTFPLPTGTAISILDVSQLLVDGKAMDLPEIQKLDLEMDFKLKFDLSDLTPITLTKSANFTYLLKMKGTYAPMQVRVRCPQKQDFVYEGERLGKIDVFTEEVFYQDQLPIETLSGGEFIVKATCKNHFPSEILVTDGLMYTSRPKL
jgi:hypothetical protein